MILPDDFFDPNSKWAGMSTDDYFCYQICLQYEKQIADLKQQHKNELAEQKANYVAGIQGSIHKGD